MAHENQSYTEGLAQITTEEGQLAYGIQRYFLGVIAAVLWAAFLAYVLTDIQMPFRWGDGIVPGVAAVLAILSIGFTGASWWANRIHQKLTDLRTHTEGTD